MSKTLTIATWVFGFASAVFFGGMIALLGVMLLAYVMPAWWQWVFLALAIPTLAALPIWIIAGCVAIFLRRLALKEASNV